MEREFADLVFLDGNVITVDEKMRRAEAIAVKDGKILKVGSEDEITALIGGETKKIDLKGRAVLPGFIDPHEHMMSYSVFTHGPWVDVNEWIVHSIKDLQEQVRKKIQTIPKGEWVMGRGWSDGELGRLPTRWDLDEVAPDNPVFLRNSTGHYCVVNSLALKIAGVTKDTPDPPGGMILRDEQGTPTGVCIEKAEHLFLKFLKNPSEEEMVEVCRRGLQGASRYGYTTIANIQIPWQEGLGYDPIELRPFFKLHETGELPIRARIYQQAYRLPGGTDHTYVDHLIGIGIRLPFGDDMLEITGIKVISDGSTSMSTAAMRQPYADDPNNVGVMHYTQEEMNALVMKCHKAGYQMLIHANGDRAIDTVLNAYENALNALPNPNHRHRIEHVFVLHDDQIKRIRKLGILVGGLPLFMRPKVFQKCLERMSSFEHYYRRYKSLMREGVLVYSGTDCHPHGDRMNPIRIIQHQVQGWNPYLPDEKYTVEEAIRTWTINAAYALFEEDKLGSIEEGKLADFVVLSGDPFKVPPDKIKDITVEMTIVGGKTVYQKT